MPVTPTYPGVYIEEIPSGVRTITGVATSITAFIGRALRGPVNEAITINSYADFERVFGGLWVESAMSYAVRDFYLNGGSQATIVRLFKSCFATDANLEKAKTAAMAVVTAIEQATVENVASTAQTEADKYASESDKTAAQVVADAVKEAAAETAATMDSVKAAANVAVGVAAPLTKARLKVNSLELEAADEGAWGNTLRARVDYEVKDPDAEDLFSISIWDGSTGQVEQFRNVSVNPNSPRRVDKVLDNESSLVRAVADVPLPPTRPKASDADLNQKIDKAGENAASDDDKAAASAAEEELRKLPFTTDKRSTGVADKDKATDGKTLVETDFNASEADKTGLYALEKTDLFNLLCIPPYNSDGNVDAGVVTAAATYCEKRRAMLLVDAPSEWTSKDKAKSGVDGVGTNSKNAAIFFPRLRQPNLLRDSQIEDFAPCGTVAGVFARTDAQRGVWKAPAGLEATLVGAPQLSVPLTDAENGELNPLGINCLRTMPAAGRVIWGSRTLQGDDRLASEWKYIPVRRLALFIEESLYRGTQWVVFEPNDEPLWAQIRLNLGAFMQNLFRQGAFQGETPKEAYFVKCDKETTTQNDINLGIVNIVVGFAPLKPAEFVIIKLQQMAGQVEV